MCGAARPARAELRPRPVHRHPEARAQQASKDAAEKSRAVALRGSTLRAAQLSVADFAMGQKTITTLSGSIAAGVVCACPRCGKGKLFKGFVTLRPRCEVCGLDYSFADSGDGPAVFIMFFAGAIVVGAALITEALYHPPYWVHAALWLPLILIVTLGPLRPMKGLMIALQ